MEHFTAEARQFLWAFILYHISNIQIKPLQYILDDSLINVMDFLLLRPRLLIHLHLLSFLWLILCNDLKRLSDLIKITSLSECPHRIENFHTFAYILLPVDHELKMLAVSVYIISIYLHFLLGFFSLFNLTHSLLDVPFKSGHYIPLHLKLYTRGLFIKFLLLLRQSLRNNDFLVVISKGLRHLSLYNWPLLIPRVLNTIDVRILIKVTSIIFILHFVTYLPLNLKNCFNFIHFISNNIFNFFFIPFHFLFLQRCGVYDLRE